MIQDAILIAAIVIGLAVYFGLCEIARAIRNGVVNVRIGQVIQRDRDDK